MTDCILFFIAFRLPTSNCPLYKKHNVDSILPAQTYVWQIKYYINYLFFLSIRNLNLPLNERVGYIYHGYWLKYSSGTNKIIDRGEMSNAY